MPLTLEQLQENLLAFIEVQLAKMKQSILEMPAAEMNVVLTQFENTHLEEYMGYEFIRHETLREFIHTLARFDKWGVGGGKIDTIEKLNGITREDFYYAELEDNYEDWGVASFPFMHIRSSEGGIFTQIAFPELEGAFSFKIRKGDDSGYSNWSSLSGGSGGEMTAAQIAAKLDTFTATAVDENTVFIGEGKKKYSVASLVLILDALFADAIHTHSYDNLTNKPVVTNEGDTAITVGGIPSGTSLEGKTALEVFDLMLYPELWPTLTAPSQTFTITPSGLQEVGASVTIVKAKSFSRGSINPQYQSASAYRSGPLTDYTEAGVEGAYTVVLGVQNWTCRANYAVGEQPKGSKGTNYQTPLAAGYTSTITRSITGVYPVYATTANIAVLTKQTLSAHGSDISVAMVAEDDGKQTIRIPQAWGTIAVLQQYNTLSGQWDNIPLSIFTKTAVEVTVNGNTVNYWEYEHNGATIGARTLKFKL